MAARLAADRARLLERAYSASTNYNEACAWRYWTLFTAATARPLFLRLGDSPAETADHSFALADFATYLSQQPSKSGGLLSAQRVADLCAQVGKRHLHLLGVDPVARRLDLHRRVIRSLRKEEKKAGKVTRRKLPFTKSMLLKCAARFNTSNLHDLELWTAFNLAVEFLLRVSEVIPTDSDHWPRRCEAAFEVIQGSHYLTLKVRSSKCGEEPCSRVVATAAPTGI